MRWIVSAIVLLLGRGRRHARVERERIVAPGAPNRGAESLVVALFAAAAVCGIAFPVIYAVGSIRSKTQFLGLALGLCLAFLAAACIVIAHRLIVTEELEHDYPPPAHPEAQEEVEQIVEESASRFTRKRLLVVTGGAAATALGVALVTPALSFGPVFDLDPLFQTPWRRGRKLVDDFGRVYHADDIEEETFYTAYPLGADREQMGAPLVVVRLPPGDLRLPAGRAGWAPRGILAYSKICTHAGCAVSLYRKPTFPRVEPRPALVCPCHYSTFDPARGAEVIFGPAGRPLPQLPLAIGAGGELVAAGNFSGAVGPSWWGVRNRSTRS